MAALEPARPACLQFSLSAQNGDFVLQPLPGIGCAGGGLGTGMGRPQSWGLGRKAWWEVEHREPVPQSEVIPFPKGLRSLTGGEGVPRHLREGVLVTRNLEGMDPQGPDGPIGRLSLQPTQVSSSQGTRS